MLNLEDSSSCKLASSEADVANSDAVLIKGWKHCLLLKDQPGGPDSFLFGSITHNTQRCASDPTKSFSIPPAPLKVVTMMAPGVKRMPPLLEPERKEEAWEDDWREKDPRDAQLST